MGFTVHERANRSSREPRGMLAPLFYLDGARGVQFLDCCFFSGS